MPNHSLLRPAAWLRNLSQMQHAALLAAAGLMGGAMNAVAGGGSFVTFPALVLAGLPPVIANASSTVALFPGTVASTFAYRREFGRVPDVRLRVMAPISMLGGAVGAALLLATPAHLFDAVIPVLLLLATLTFASGARAGLALRRVVTIGPGGLLPLQFLVSIYGGYFGGAVGLMRQSVAAITGADPHMQRSAPDIAVAEASHGSPFRQSQ